MGNNQLLVAFDTMPWLRAVVGKISWMVSSTPWCLYVATNKQSGKAVRNRMIQRSMDPRRRFEAYKDLRSRDSLREIGSHMSLDLLDHGNTEFPGISCVQLTQEWLDLVGDALWVLDKNGFQMGDGSVGIPTDIWPFPTTWIHKWPSATDPFYGITIPGRATITPHRDNTILFRNPRPSNPYARELGGSAISQALSDELETDEYAAKHLKHWFKNQARPDILITGEDMRKDEVEKLENNWIKQLTGVTNVKKPHFINRKIDIKEIGQTFQEMQLSELRKDQRDIIVHTFGFPPELLGILENSNRATIDAAGYLGAKYVTVPRLEYLRIMLQVNLIERYDERLILDYQNPVLEDKEHELNVMKSAPFAVKVDEWRERAGLPPLEGGKGQVFVSEFNKVSFEDFSEIEAGSDDAPAGGVPPTSEY